MAEDYTQEELRKVKQNKDEKIAFKNNLHNLVKYNTRINKPLTIGTTPNSLIICGASADLDLTISKKVVDKCLRPEIRDENGKLADKTGHGLDEDKLFKALEQIKNPILIIKGNRPDSLVVVTDLQDSIERQVLVSILLNKRGSSAQIHEVTSAYGRSEFKDYIEEQVKKGNIIAMNNKKAEKLFQSIGKKYPEPKTIIGFNDSIAYSTRSVKYPENKINIKDMISKNRIKANEMFTDINKIHSKNRGQGID